MSLKLDTFMRVLIRLRRKHSFVSRLEMLYLIYFHAGIVSWMMLGFEPPQMFSGGLILTFHCPHKPSLYASKKWKEVSLYTVELIFSQAFIELSSTWADRSFLRANFSLFSKPSLCLPSIIINLYRAWANLQFPISEDHLFLRKMVRVNL